MKKKGYIIIGGILAMFTLVFAWLSSNIHKVPG